MVPEPAEIGPDKIKHDEDFRLVSDEIVRQFNVQASTYDSNDTKAGILLGFVLLILSTITLNSGFVQAVAADQTSIWFFVAGLLGMAISFILGCMAYFVGDFHNGIKIGDLLNIYKGSEDWNLEMVISRKLFDSVNDNSKILDRKSALIKWSTVVFGIGFTFIGLSGLLAFGVIK